MGMNDRLEENISKISKNIEKVEESLDFMRQTNLRKTDMIIGNYFIIEINVQIDI